MANIFPVFTWVVNEADLAAGIPTQEDILAALPQSIPEHRWLSSSRNSAHQRMLKSLIEGHKEYQVLAYLTELVSVVRPTQVPQAVEALRRLLSEIGHDPSELERKSGWGYSGEELLEFLKAAQPARDIHADYVEPLAFFMFLLSQLAVLEQARTEGQCVYYIQMR